MQRLTFHAQSQLNQVIYKQAIVSWWSALQRIQLASIGFGEAVQVWLNKQVQNKDSFSVKQL